LRLQRVLLGNSLPKLGQIERLGIDYGLSNKEYDRFVALGRKYLDHCEEIAEQKRLHSVKPEKPKVRAGRVTYERPPGSFEYKLTELRKQRYLTWENTITDNQMRASKKSSVGADDLAYAAKLKYPHSLFKIGREVIGDLELGRCFSNDP